MMTSVADSLIPVSPLAAPQRWPEGGILTPEELRSPQVMAANPQQITPQELALLQRAFDWLEPEMTREVEKKPGVREGVCPFVKPSLDNNHFYLAAARSDKSLPPVKAVEAELRRFMPWFETLEPTQPPHQILRALVLVFPPEYADYLLPAIDTKKTRAKTDLIARGLMMGEFFESCPFAATWDSNYFPLKSPVPFYALRTLIESDWRFIQAEPEWQRLYIERFGTPPAHVLSKTKTPCPLTRLKRWIKSLLGV